MTNLSSEIFKDGGEINRGPRSNTLRIPSFLEEASYTAHRELETSFARP